MIHVHHKIQFSDRGGLRLGYTHITGICSKVLSVRAFANKKPRGRREPSDCSGRSIRIKGFEFVIAQKLGDFN